METAAMVGELYRHLEWAEAEIWRVVLALPGASGDKPTYDRLHHIQQVQWAYLNAWRGTPFDPGSFGSPPLAELAAGAAGFHAAVQEHVRGLEPAALDRELVVPWAAMLERHWRRSLAVPTVGQTLVQVVMHSAYHRGQVSARLRELGGDPPLTDYVAWLWFGNPAPRWPQRE